MGTTPSAPFHQKYQLTSRRLGLLAEPDFTWVKSGASKTCKVVRLVAEATTSSCSGGRSRGEDRPPWGTTPGAAEQTREEAGDARKGRVRSCRGQERSHEDQGRRGTARRIGEEADSHPPGRGGEESDSRHGDHCSSPFAAAAGSAHGSPRGNHHPLGEDYIRPEGGVRVGSRHHLEGHTHGGETATSCDHRAGCLVGSRKRSANKPAGQSNASYIGHTGDALALKLALVKLVYRSAKIGCRLKLDKAIKVSHQCTPCLALGRTYPSPLPFLPVSE